MDIFKELINKILYRDFLLYCKLIFLKFFLLVVLLNVIWIIVYWLCFESVGFFKIVLVEKIIWSCFCCRVFMKSVIDVYVLLLFDFVLKEWVFLR